MKLLGEYLRELTNLSTEDLIDALRYQVNLEDEGQPSRLGVILVSWGLATEQEVAEALVKQDRDREIFGRNHDPASQTASYWVSRGRQIN